MASSPSPDDRRHRLQQLADKWGAASLPVIAPLTRSHQLPVAPTVRTPNDEYQAEELLKRQKLGNPQSQASQGGSIRRGMTITKKKGWEPKEIFEALDAVVTVAGSPGVAEALIAKLVSVGGDVNIASAKTKTNLLTRRKSMESLERSRLLQKAIGHEQTDMIAVLVPHADSLTLDNGLPHAIRSGNKEIVAILLRHGANASQSADGQDAFYHLCRSGEQSDLVGMILASDGRPSPEVVSQGMVAAAKRGCKDTVLRLSRTTADGNHNNAEALQEAIAKTRVDIALAILTGTRPPSGQRLNDAFQSIFAHTNIMPDDKVALADGLLCAGTSGDIVDNALLQAAQADFMDMVHLLIYHGASIEYQDASILRWAISQQKYDLTQGLLSEWSSLNPMYASGCVACMHKSISNEDRYTILNLLLRKGASGQALNDCLVEAAEAGDEKSVRLLLTPEFPGSRSLGRQDVRRGPHHATASLDAGGGKALQLAVLTANIPMLEFMLTREPSMETLSGAFRGISNLSLVDRYPIAETLLSTGLTGRCVNEALQVAINEHPPRKDPNFIALLLAHNADPGFNGGASILAAVTHQDIPLLQRLLQSPVHPGTVAPAVATAMAISNPTIRTQAMFLLLRAGAGKEGVEVAEALETVLRVDPVDLQLLDMLLKQGPADVNFHSGSPVILAIRSSDPQVLKLLLETGRVAAETFDVAFRELSKLPSTLTKATKLEAILRRTKRKGGLNQLLIDEVKAAIGTPRRERVYTVVKVLLDAGADVNAKMGEALCQAVAAASMNILELLLASQSPRATPLSLAFALPHALQIQDSMDRLTFAQKLVEAGVDATQVNRALIYAIETYPGDLPLINTLASRSDASDGKALCLAVGNGRSAMVEVLLRKRKEPSWKAFPQPVLDKALGEATKVQDREQRMAMCAALLKAGTSGRAASDALLAAAADGDLALGSVLVGVGASVEYQDGQPIAAAARAGSVDVLQMLLKAPARPTKATLERGFQAATEISDLRKRLDIFRILLEQGVEGKVVDEQLVSSARYGEDGVELIKLLLKFGASPDFDSGQAVWNSTRSAFITGLDLMLGLAGLGERQKKPSQATMLRALKASSLLSGGPRYQVMESLFKAGLEATEAIHVALHKAVNDDAPDLKLIQLLHANGASPLTNGCGALVDVTRKLLLPVLTIFLEADISQGDLNWTFEHTFTLGHVDTWLSEKGFGVAQVLLEKGVKGNGVSTALVIAIDDCGTERDALARRFVDLLIKHQVDVNFMDGVPLQAAAKLGDSGIIRLLLALHPTERTLSMAFPYIFHLERAEEETLDLITLFGDYQNKEERVDFMFHHPNCEPVLFRAVTQYPRSTKIVQALLDAGCYHEQWTRARVMPEIDEDEEVSLLFWALLQPQKKVSSNIIELLVSRGAKINVETRLSKRTPLMLAIQTRRPDLVKVLILANAEVDVSDATRNTPLTMATRIGGDLGTEMMGILLAAEPSKNDGSLHNASRELNLAAMRVLVASGHDPDFPSPLHDGRSALGEICLHASDMGEVTAAKEKQMEKAMAYLLDHGTELSIKVDGKSVLLLALESQDPLPTTRALLKLGMWKHINNRSNYYVDETHTYSPTMYLTRFLPPRDIHDQLLTLLRANRATDVYYAHGPGPQPEGATGLPDELLLAERARQARAERINEEGEDHGRALARTREAAALEDQILTNRAELEAARSRSALGQAAEAARERARLEEEAWAGRMRRRRSEQREALEHGSRVASAELSRVQLVGDAEAENASRRQAAALEWRTGELEGARQLSGVRVREAEELARLQREGDARAQGRLLEQRRLVDAQSGLVGRMAEAGVNGRRQIGYITGELPD